MNEFERKIREAMAVTRNNANPRLPTSGTVGKTTAEIAALSFGARALAAKLRPGSAGVAAPPEHPAYEAETAAPESAEPAPGDRQADAAPTSSGLFGRAALSKPGVMMGHWDNPLIAAAGFSCF